MRPATDGDWQDWRDGRAFTMTLANVSINYALSVNDHDDAPRVPGLPERISVVTIHFDPSGECLVRTWDDARFGHCNPGPEAAYVTESDAEASAVLALVPLVLARLPRHDSISDPEEIRRMYRGDLPYGE